MVTRRVCGIMTSTQSRAYTDEETGDVVVKFKRTILVRARPNGEVELSDGGHHNVRPDSCSRRNPRITATDHHAAANERGTQPHRHPHHRPQRHLDRLRWQEPHPLSRWRGTLSMGGATRCPLPSLRSCHNRSCQPRAARQPVGPCSSSMASTTPTCTSAPLLAPHVRRCTHGATWHMHHHTAQSTCRQGHLRPSPADTPGRRRACRRT